MVDSPVRKELKKMLGHDDHEGATKVTTNVRQVRRGLCAFVVHPIAIHARQANIIRIF